MIPILFDATATNFNTNGIGAITDCLSCEVTEERNGVYELEMVVPVTTPHFSNIVEGNIVVCKPFLNGSRQAFEIDRITKPIDQKVSVRATHISYRASYVPIKPFIATGITATLAGFTTNASVANPFTIVSDFTNETSTYNQLLPKSLRACFGGTEGSLLDTFGGGGAGEYEWDNFTIHFWQHRGSDKGVSLRYRKNITAFDQVTTNDDLITGVVPFWTNEDDSIVFFEDPVYAANHTDYPNERVVPLDLSDQFDSAPSSAELIIAAQQYLANTSNTLPETNISLTYVDLGEEDINLCDTVHVLYDPLGITFTAKVIKTVWDVLLERYESIEIGTPKSNIAQTIATAQGDINSLVQQGQKLVSVTQSINTDIGEIQNSVATVQESLTDLNGEFINTVSTLSSKVQQNTDSISAQVTETTKISSDVAGLENKVTTLGTYVDLKADGLHITQNTDGSYVLITDSGMEIFVKYARQAYATTEGFNASAFIVGDWHIAPANNGDSLNFFKKE